MLSKYVDNYVAPSVDTHFYPYVVAVAGRWQRLQYMTFLLSLLLGDTGRGLALLVLYAVGLIVHTLLEPRLLAGQADLPPITALLAMYLGFHFMGVGGMVLMPVCLLLLKQFQDAGVVKLWR